jgi:hypothetical protein
MSRPEDPAVTTGRGSPVPRGAEDPDALAYQSPGGFWSEAADPSGPPPRYVEEPGMALDRQQHVALMTAARKRDEAAECTNSAIENGLLYAGRCPRCAHWTQTQITFGLLVSKLWADADQIHLSCDPNEPFEFVKSKLRRLPFLPEPQPAEPVKRLTFVCACGEPHAGRPDGAALRRVWRRVESARASQRPQAQPGRIRASGGSRGPRDRCRPRPARWTARSGSSRATISGVEAAKP